ncbi:MAG: hypothetical protein WDA75_01345 [Candidatus Latescibacterota bacterium]|jgi:adenosine deaminase
MTGAKAAKACELHVHLGGCLFTEDLLDLGREVYPRVDWRLYVTSFTRAFGTSPDPVVLFREALTGSKAGLARFRRHYVFDESDGGDFSRFQAKFNLAICLYRHWWLVLGREQEVNRRVVERHRSEGVRYVEYRAMAPYGPDQPEGFLAFHTLVARTLREASDRTFRARYLISLPRWAAHESYLLVRQLLDQHPELVRTVVGLDFCFFEEGHPPAAAAPLFARVHADNARCPDQALGIAYHVGETYDDKSLESAVRWCHQAAELGARRLGHALALGLDPEVAIGRRPAAHETESAAERLAQIEYDLRHRSGLQAHGVPVKKAALERERAELQRRPPASLVRRSYTPERLAEVRQRQTFALAQLAELGTVIESCPTSNLRIGGVPAPELHPLHRFLASPVNLAIGADDPGIFDVTLAHEVDWAATHSGMSATQFARRLGSPRRFRLDAGLRP